jgi:hypothetical protein
MGREILLFSLVFLYTLVLFRQLNREEPQNTIPEAWDGFFPDDKYKIVNTGSSESDTTTNKNKPLLYLKEAFEWTKSTYPEKSVLPTLCISALDVVLAEISPPKPADWSDDVYEPSMVQPTLVCGPPHLKSDWGKQNESYYLKLHKARVLNTRDRGKAIPSEFYTNLLEQYWSSNPKKYLNPDSFVEKTQNDPLDLRGTIKANIGVPKPIPAGSTRIECGSLDTFSPSQKYCVSTDIAIDTNKVPKTTSVFSEELDLPASPGAIRASCSLDQQRWFSNRGFGGGASGWLYYSLDNTDFEENKQAENIRCDAWFDNFILFLIIF